MIFIRSLTYFTNAIVRDHELCLRDIDIDRGGVGELE